MISRGPVGSRHLLTILALTALLVVGLAGEAAAQMATGRGRIAGRVADIQGNPVAGATVILTHVESGSKFELTTDDEGRFNKGSMGRGAWNIDVIAPGYLPAPLAIRLGEEQNMRGVNIELTPGEAGESGNAATFGAALGDAVTAANELYVAGDFAAATAQFEAIMTQFDPEKEPNLYLVHLNVANSAYEMGDYDKAMANYEAVLAKEAGNFDARLGVAKVYMMQRKIDEALAEVEKIDLAEIKDAIVFYNIGSLLFDQGQSAASSKYYELALQRNPNFADAHMQLSLAFIQQGKFDEAKPHLQKVIELDPESANAALAQEFLASLQ